MGGGGDTPPPSLFYLGGGCVAEVGVAGFGVTLVGDGHGAVAGFVFTGVFLFVSLLFEFAAEVAEPGTLAEGFVAVVAAAGDPLTAGHGAFVFMFVLPLVVEVVPVVLFVEVADAGTLVLGLVVEVADAGVLPTLLLIPWFCWVAGVAELGVLPAVGVMPCEGVMPCLGVIP